MLHVPSALPRARACRARRAIAPLLVVAVAAVGSPASAAEPAADTARSPAPAAVRGYGDVMREAGIALKEGRHAEAAELLDQAFSMVGRPSLRCDAARAYEQAGNYPRALKRYKECALSKLVPEAQRTQALEGTKRVCDAAGSPQGCEEDGIAEPGAAPSGGALPGCLSDRDCKGDRVCHSHDCVAPSVAAPAPVETDPWEGGPAEPDPAAPAAPAAPPAEQHGYARANSFSVQGNLTLNSAGGEYTVDGAASDLTDRLDLSFGVSLSYFAIEGLSLGIALIDQLANKTSESSESSSNTFTFAFEPAYTARFRGTPIFMYVEGLLGYSTGSSETNSKEIAFRNTQDFGGLAIGGGAGLGVAIGDQRGAAISLGFSALYQDVTAEVTQTGSSPLRDVDMTMLTIGLSTQLAAFF